VLGFEATTKREGEITFLTGGIVAIDGDGMAVGEALQEMSDIGIILLILRLKHLIDISVGSEFRRIDRERYQQADVVLLDEITHGLHHFRIERTDNQIAVGSMGILQELVDV